MAKRDPINPTDGDARSIAAQLLKDVRFGALAVTHPQTAAPYVARVALIWSDRTLLSLLSTLSTHTKALQNNATCAALVGEPGAKGDPLTHPRMTISATAIQIDKAPHKATWLAQIPKAQLYYDFTDFVLFKLDITAIALNGGFGKAYHLTPEDLP